MAKSTWSTPLPRPITIPEVMTLKRLADVRKLLEHLPAAHREKSTWRYVADRLDDAARGADVIDLVVPLRMVLSMERIVCRPEIAVGHFPAQHAGRRLE